MENTIRISLIFVFVFVLFCFCDRKQNKIDNPVVSMESDQARYKSDAIRKIDSLENKIRTAIRDSAKSEIDIKLAMYTAQAYQNYALDFKQDRLAPEYLMRSASILHGALKDPERAAEIYGNVHDKFLDFNNRPLALFLQANALYDADNKEAAITQLRLFLIRYPQDSLANQARQFIRYIKKPFKIPKN